MRVVWWRLGGDTPLLRFATGGDGTAILTVTHNDQVAERDVELFEFLRAQPA